MRHHERTTHATINQKAELREMGREVGGEVGGESSGCWGQFCVSNRKVGWWVVGSV